MTSRVSVQWLSVTLNNNRGLTAKKTTRPTVVSLFSKTLRTDTKSLS